jgi:hypothetical protein
VAFWIIGFWFGCTAASIDHINNACDEFLGKESIPVTRNVLYAFHRRANAERTGPLIIALEFRVNIERVPAMRSIENCEC